MFVDCILDKNGHIPEVLLNRWVVRLIRYQKYKNLSNNFQQFESKFFTEVSKNSHVKTDQNINLKI